MLQYIPLSNLPYSHIPLHDPSLTKSVLDALASLCTALASAVYTLCHLPIKPMIIHILISISHSTAPKYCITALDIYVMPLLHYILTTQFIYTYFNIKEKSPQKSPKYKN
ncbi:CCT_1a_G0025870.mRNA.1.CDS.1 [Saccharomyces cerevisiae]|nr:CCT_1a_G0025870.mRNA.1.CDS.1 [Saccharomyces cerevisiae]CAI7346998.1 CCT_1a_G0025870.mRNA.1.CDS.1 [Saccharomyces cerevisiae]